MVLIVDFGSQTTHLIGRRIKHLGSSVVITTPEEALEKVREINPKGIILSGGPSSVYEEGAPTIDPNIFEVGIPLLGICYGFQIAAHLLGGKVISGRKEYGPAAFQVVNPHSRILQGVPEHSTVWMSHGDEIVAIPENFSLIGSTPHVPNTAAEDAEKQLYMLQFHPEVDHTEYGMRMLENFLSICGIEKQEQLIDIDSMINKITQTVADAYVIGAVSGGVDSTVAGVLTAKAIGQKFIPIYVDNGLMREGTTEDVKKIFGNVDISPVIIECEDDMLSRLEGITDPEEKRKIIGAFYIELFEKQMHRLIADGKDVKFLLQGTIYSDVIESKGTKHADKIKSHHNVGGLPEDMKLTLLEPLRDFYKDEVRAIGTRLGIPAEFVHKQKFPGPGYAVRIRGEVTKDRLMKERMADTIVLEELKKANLLETVFHSFPVMTGAYSVAVKGDGRAFEEVIALRVTTSKDEMTFGWAHLPYDILQKISSRIVNEVPRVSRVLFDITTKPPATVEWE